MVHNGSPTIPSIPKRCSQRSELRACWLGVERMHDARLVYYSQPPDGGSSIDEMIVYCARVSNPASQAAGHGIDRLISFLVRNQHWSPFEMASVCIEITTTRDIARQILRHRSFSFQEFSQRYSVVPESPVIRPARAGGTRNRQKSEPIDHQDPIHKEWESIQEDVIRTSMDAYKWALDHGIAKEQARAVLPEGNTPSRLYMNGTVRSWIHYIRIRSTPDTQEEHRLIAHACSQVLQSIAPITCSCLGLSDTIG